MRVLSGLVPLLVEANGALLRALEAEQAHTAAHPSEKPRKPLCPIRFVASYLMRNNPRHPTPLLYAPSNRRVWVNAQ